MFLGDDINKGDKVSDWVSGERADGEGDIGFNTKCNEPELEHSIMQLS